MVVMVSGDMQLLTVDQLKLLRQCHGQHDGVFRRPGVCRGSRTSDTSSGRYSPYSSVCSTFSDYSSTSDVSAAGSVVEFDVSELTVTAADSDVEDGFTESSPVNQVRAACTLIL